MRRMILGFAAMALVGFAASDASACCHKKACATPCAAPAPVYETVACAPKKKCLSMPKFKMPKIGCHKKAVCAPAPTCNTGCNEVAYAAPQTTWAAPQAAPSGQYLAVPQK